MTKFFCLIIFLLIGCAGFGQQIALQGRVMNPTDNSGIHIFNKTSNFNTITNQRGEFTLDVGLQDTLYFSSIRYSLKEVVISAAIFNSKTLQVTLEDRINELDEVLLGNQLSGNLLQDISGITLEEKFNFDDVGIPGFTGTPEEKIVPIVPSLGTATRVDLESLYKHLSGYYRKLRLQRKWDKQNNMAVTLMAYYTNDFFIDAYNIPENYIYDFVLYCIETTTIEQDFNAKNYALVLNYFDTAAAVYVARIKNNTD